MKTLKLMTKRPLSKRKIKFYFLGMPIAKIVFRSLKMKIYFIGVRVFFVRYADMPDREPRQERPEKRAADGLSPEAVQTFAQLLHGNNAS